MSAGIPGCLPLPECSERVLVSIADDRPDHQQTIWTLPVGNKMVLPVINTTISETSEETSNILLPCDQEPCVARDYGGRVSVWDFAEMTLSGESGTAERENRKVREVVQTRDQNGNIIYQWYDQDGHLHTNNANGSSNGDSQCIFKACWKFLYPEYFGSSIPAGGGWYQWQYWKARRTADRPENTGQQRWPTWQTRHQPNGKTARPVASVQPVQQTRFHKISAPSSKQSVSSHHHQEGALGRTVENEIDRLLMEFDIGLYTKILQPDIRKTMTAGNMDSIATR